MTDPCGYPAGDCALGDYIDKLRADLRNSEIRAARMHDAMRDKDETRAALVAIELQQQAERECDRLRAERDALRADAERYRWLRGHFRVFSPHIDGQHHWCPTGDVGRITGPTLDAAIDAAREQSK